MPCCQSSNSAAAAKAVGAGAAIVRWSVALLLAVMSSAAGQASGAGCPADVRRRTAVYGGLCNQFVNVEKTWVNARQHCRQQSRISPGRLVNVPDAATQRWLAAEINATGWTSNSGVWLGLHDRDSELRFVWDQYDGNDTRASFTYWAPDEPDNSRNQNCVYMRRQYSWRWMDVECNLPALRTYFFICQYRLVGGFATATSTSRTMSVTSSYPPQYALLTSPGSVATTAAAAATSPYTIQVPQSPSTAFGNTMPQTTQTSDSFFSGTSEKPANSTSSSIADETLATAPNQSVLSTSSSLSAFGAQAISAEMRPRKPEPGGDLFTVLSETSTPPPPISSHIKTSTSFGHEQSEVQADLRSLIGAPTAGTSDNSSDTLRHATTKSASFLTDFATAEVSTMASSRFGTDRTLIFLEPSIITSTAADGAETGTFSSAISVANIASGTINFNVASGTGLPYTGTFRATPMSNGSTTAEPEPTHGTLLTVPHANDDGVYVGASLGAAVLILAAVLIAILGKRSRMLRARARENLDLHHSGVENPVYSACDVSESATFQRRSDGSGPGEICTTVFSPENELRFPLLKQVGRY